MVVPSEKKGMKWLDLVKITLRENPGKSFKQVLKIAKKSYRKTNKASSKGARKSRRNNKTKRGGSGSSSSSSGEQKSQNSQQHGGNQQEQQGELPVGKQSGGNSGNPLLDMVKGAGSSQKGGSSGSSGNPLLDMVKGAGPSQKGGSGGGSSAGKAVFGENAAPVA